MNILSINKFFWKKGGSEAVFFTEKELLEKHGHKVIPFSMSHKKNLPSPYSNYFVEEVDYTRGGFLAKMQSAFKIIYSFDARGKMKRLLEEQSIDISHFHIFQHQISPSVFAPLRKKKIPIILTLHDLKPVCPNYMMYVNGKVCERCKGRKFYHAFLNRCTKDSYFKSLINTIEMYFHYFMGYYQNVDKYIAVSQFHRNKMIENGFAPEQIALLPNCIDTEKFYFSTVDDNYALFIGRVSKEKGIKTLIDAARLSPEIKIIVVGTGPDKEKLMLQAEQLHLLNVEFAGYQSGQKLIELIAHSSFTVIPSIVYENCPMSILESFSMGKAVIGSDIGGIPELINENIDGLTFIPGDAPSLAQKMSMLWKDKEKRQLMGKQGRDKIVKDFNSDKHYQQLQSIYQQLFSAKGLL